MRYMSRMPTIPIKAAADLLIVTKASESLAGITMRKITVKREPLSAVL